MTTFEEFIRALSYRQPLRQHLDQLEAIDNFYKDSTNFLEDATSDFLKLDEEKHLDKYILYLREKEQQIEQQIQEDIQKLLPEQIYRHTIDYYKDKTTQPTPPNIGDTWPR